MNKAEAMEVLGMSKRTLEKYQGNGRLPFTYIKGKTGEVADFHPDDVARLKEELASEARSARHVSTASIARPASGVTSARGATSEGGASTARPAIREGSATLARVEVSPVSPWQGSATDFAELLSESFEKALKSSVSDLKAKATLSFPEAQIVTGIPERQLREAAKAGQFKEVKIGRGLRIKTSDAIAYAESLFK